jgi:hypothetical protein
MMKSSLGSIAILLAAIVACACGAEDDKYKQLPSGEEMPTSAWVRELKSLPTSYRPKTAIDRDDEEPEFVKRLGQSLDGKVLKVTGKIRQIDWKDGVGQVWIDAAGVSQADRLEIRLNAPFTIRIDKDDARKIVKGQSFELRAVADFIPGAMGRTHSKNAQHSRWHVEFLILKGSNNSLDAGVNGCIKEF